MKHILKKTFRVGWSVLLVTGFLCGCASTKQVLPKPAVEKPTPNKALIVMEYPPAMVWDFLGLKVYDNNKLVGKIGPDGKLVWLRDPGLMNITLGGPYCETLPGKCFAVKAGKSYHYNTKLVVVDGNMIFGGPGVPTRTIGQPAEGALVFFEGSFPTEVKVLWSLSPAQRKLTIANIKTGKTVECYLPREKQSHISLFLPPGEYCILKCSAYQDGGTYTATEEYNINAEFSVTKPNVAVYVGSISVSRKKEKNLTETALLLVKGQSFDSSAGEKPVIRKDSAAARKFLKQTNMDLPYTEAIMELNE